MIDDSHVRKFNCRLTVDPEYGRWVAAKRKWGFNDIVKAGLLAATLIGITAVAVQPQLWPTSQTPAYPSLGSSNPGQQLSATPVGEMPAVASPAERGFSGTVEGQNETGIVQSKSMGIADSLSEPKKKLEAQFKSGQKFFKVG